MKTKSVTTEPQRVREGASRAYRYRGDHFGAVGEKAKAQVDRDSYENGAMSERQGGTVHLLHPWRQSEGAFLIHFSWIVMFHKVKAY